jgi:hypothetical protein
VEIIEPATDSEMYDNNYYLEERDELGWYIDLTVMGRATDPEDGPLNGSALVWTVEYGAVRQALPDTGSEVHNVRLYLNMNCGQEVDRIGEWYTITLTATDSGGETSNASRNIFIWRFCNVVE